MEFENACIWCWIIPLLVGVICAFLGYLIGRGAKGESVAPAELKSLKEKNAKLEAELAACNKKLAEKPKGPSEASGISDTGIASGIASKAKAFDASAAKAAMGKNIRVNDLKVVEGIGPKIEGLFHNFDIKTWEALAESSVAKCQEVLDSGGDRYRLHDPASWPMQARMCHEGNWKDLARWQREHKHGKL